MREPRLGKLQQAMSLDEREARLGKRGISRSERDFFAFLRRRREEDKDPMLLKTELVVRELSVREEDEDSTSSLCESTFLSNKSRRTDEGEDPETVAGEFFSEFRI